MTIWFSTNIPEMRAISTFNRVSKDISEIQERIATGQRINSGKDDPGGLIVREGLRADIKSIHSAQANMTQAEVFMDSASSGMNQLLEILNGDSTDPSSSGLLKTLDDQNLSLEQKEAQVADYLSLYDSVVNTTTYGTEKLLDGSQATTGKTYQMGDGTGTLAVKIADLRSATTLGAAPTFATDADVATFRASVEAALTTVSKASGDLGLKQQIAATNQNLLDTRLTSVTASEGRISNIDSATESSRMARAELLADNAMNSILYTRQYAAFSVSSLFG
jgi:flagellin